jgi:hypothetical protein
MVGDTAVHILEETNYPFHGVVRLIVNPAAQVRFPLRLRIPAWAKGTILTVNGQVQQAPEAGSFARIERNWNAADLVEINFPMEPRVERGFHDSISVARGPLVFSYGIGESWVKLRERGKASDWQVFPKSEWNYALSIDTDDLAKSIAVSAGTVGLAPFSATHAPVKLRMKARKVPSWRAEDGVADAVPLSPVKSDEPEETITLIPYAAAKLRITAFPQYAAKPASGI